jgi:integral membrane protein
MLPKRGPLWDLRVAALVEGTTLVLLMGGAVPIKRVFDLPAVSSVMGTIHGLAFLIYMTMLIDALAAGFIGKRLAIRSALLAFVPTGTFWNEPSLRRRNSAIESSLQTAAGA